MIILILLLQMALEPVTNTKIIERDRLTIPLDERVRKQTQNFGLGLAINERSVFVSNSYQERFNGDRPLAFSFDLQTSLPLCEFMPESMFPPAKHPSTLVASDDLLVTGTNSSWGNAPLSGVVHVFDALTGKQIQRIAPLNSASHDNFGFSLALDHDTLVVGAPNAQRGNTETGTVYVYNAYTGELLHELSPNYATPVPTRTGLRDELQFGFSVAISQDLIAVGAPNDSTIDIFSGAVFVFDRHTGKQLYTLYSPTLQQKEQFGYRVGLNQSRVIVTGLNANVFDSVTCEILHWYVGNVHVFEAQSGRFLTSLDEPEARMMFGLGLDVSEDFIAVGGASSDDGETGSPFVHLYDPESGEYLQSLYVSWYTYGSSIVHPIAISSSTIAAGNSLERPERRSGPEGAVYLFDPPSLDPAVSQPESQP